MSKWPYSMARFTVRELSRMQRGAYPYNRVSEPTHGEEWGKRPHTAWSGSEKAVVWVVGIVLFSLFTLIWEAIIWPALVRF